MFKSKKKDSSSTSQGGLGGIDHFLPTGGRLDDMTVEIVRVSCDANEKTQRAMAQSLYEIGLKQPSLVTSAILQFLVNGGGSNAASAPAASIGTTKHRILLLSTASRVVDERVAEVDDDTAKKLIKVAMADMVKVKDVQPDHQGAASRLLVSIGAKFPDEVMNELLAQFSPGVLPHYFIVKTFADFVPANPSATVPKLKDVWARILPVLALVKQSNLRWVFATAMGNFCDAVLHHVASLESESERSNTLESFASDVFPAFEVLFTVWISSKEEKVRAATVKAVGSVCAVLTRAQFESQLPRVLPAILNMYKKDHDHLAITQGLTSVLTVGVRDGSRSLEPHLQLVLGSLHPLVCAPLDVTNSSAVRNRNELLRCFGVVGQIFPTETLNFCIAKLESRDARQRTGTVDVLKHLVTRLDPVFENRGLKALVITGVRPLVETERDVSVRKALAQLTVSMAGHGYLALEGGETMLQFIVRGCAITEAEIAAFKPAKSKSKSGAIEEEPSPAELRSVCDNVLNLVTTTIDNMDEVLWPFLFEFSVKEEFSGATGIVFKCLAYLAALKRDEEASDFQIDFVRSVNLPKPNEIVARLFVLLNAPKGRNSLAAHCLHLLQQAGPTLVPAASEMWDNAIPRLLAYLAGKDFDEARWSELVLRLVSETCKLTAAEEFAMSLGDALSEQLPLYDDDSSLKRAALKCLGLALQLTKHKEFLRNKLSSLFVGANHADSEHRAGCAQGVGFAAATHLDIVLDYLTNVVKTNGVSVDEARARAAGSAKPASSTSSGGGGGLFSSIFGGGSKSGGASGGSSSRKAGAVPTDLACTVVLAFGYTAAYADPGLLTSRIDVQICHSMAPLLTCPASKSVRFKLAATKAIDLIGKAMVPERLPSETARLESRDTLVKDLCRLITSADPSNRVTTIGLAALKTLSVLPPELPEAVESEMFEAVIGFVDAQPGAGFSEKAAKKKKAKDASDGPDEDDTKEVHDLLQENLSDLFVSVVTLVPGSADATVRLLKLLTKWMRSPKVHHRQRAVAMALAGLRGFAETFRAAQVAAAEAAAEAGTPYTIEREPTPWPSLGTSLAVFVPRLTDDDFATRATAFEAAATLLYAHHFLSHPPSDPTKQGAFSAPAVVSGFAGVARTLRESDEARHMEHGQLYALAKKVSKEVLASTEVVSERDLPFLLLGALRGLSDPRQSSAGGTCVVVNTLIASRGAELLPKVKGFTDGLLLAMPLVTDPQTLNGALHAMRTLAQHHLIPCVDVLLEASLPHSEFVVRALQVIAKDSSLGGRLLDHLCDLLNNGSVYEEVPAAQQKGADAGQQVSSRLVCAATAGLAEVLQVADLKALATSKYALLLSTALMRVGTAQGCRPVKSSDPSPAAQAHELLRAVAPAVDDVGLQSALDSDVGASASVLASPLWASGVAVLARAVGARNPVERRATLAQALTPYLKGNFPPQRVAAATVLADLVSYAGKDGDHLDGLVNAMLSAMIDPVVKREALRGLGNVAVAGAIDQYASTVLDALTGSMEHADEGIVQEAMSGLSKAFLKVHIDRVQPILVNISHRIRPAMASHNDGIRAEAFTLFGTLARFGEGAASASFREQVFNNLPVILLHANDETAAVRAAARLSLTRLAPLLGSEESLTFFTQSRHFKYPDRDLIFGEFVDDLAVDVLVPAHLDRVNHIAMQAVDQFRSDWSRIKCGAATMCGVILSKLTLEQRREAGVNPTLISKALISLLHDPDWMVRKAAAESMALLTSY